MNTAHETTVSSRLFNSPVLYGLVGSAWWVLFVIVLLSDWPKPLLAIGLFVSGLGAIVSLSIGVGLVLRRPGDVKTTIVPEAPPDLSAPPNLPLKTWTAIFLMVVLLATPIVGGLALGEFIKLIAPHLTESERRLAGLLAVGAIYINGAIGAALVWTFVRFIKPYILKAEEISPAPAEDGP